MLLSFDILSEAYTAAWFGSVDDSSASCVLSSTQALWKHVAIEIHSGSKLVKNLYRLSRNYILSSGTFFELYLVQIIALLNANLKNRL